MAKEAQLPGLTPEGCRQRQERLRQGLTQRGLDGTLLSDPRFIHYFTGYWHRGPTAATAFIPTQGPVVLVTPRPCGDQIAADQSQTYTPAYRGTMVDDQAAAALQVLLPTLQKTKRLGCDQALRPWLLADLQLNDISDLLLAMRRTKAPDELVLIRRAIAGCEAAYTEARRMLAPGISEMQLYARTMAAAIEAVGEPIGDYGNDFQSGRPGGPARRRAIEAGELLPLDLSVIVRGYWSDLSRTFCIGGKPTDGQREAHRLVMEAMAYIEATARVGVSCRQLYEKVHTMLDGNHGWNFGHHLGHGIGLAAHEAPRLNPNWDETLQVGDVFTCEPGLYSADLGGGVRIEQDYLVTESGLERLSSFPTEL